MGGVQAPALLQQRRQDLRVPAAAGPHFDHGHVGTQPEELQRLQRMAIRVTRAIRGGTMRGGKRLLDGRVAGTLRGAAARQQGGGCEQRHDSQNHFHRSPALR
jgi:hypothetical protein